MERLDSKLNKIGVSFFQRRPRKGFSFSLESIFDDVRQRLQQKIQSTTFISKCYNDGYLTKLINIIEATTRQNKSEINHITGEIHFLNMLMNTSTVVLTVLDCGMIHRKTGFSKKVVKWLYLKMPVKKSKLVTTISEVTKKEIIKYTSCDSEKIKVIPVSINPIYQSNLKVFNSDKPKILQIGTGYNKNLVRLIYALKTIQCHLTIVGKLSTEQLQALKDNTIDYSNVYNISNEQLLEKYIECDILSFVSTFEGFGMPIVEANAVERVVVTSNISSMPEVAADAACLVDPFDVESIRKGFERVINDEVYRNELISKGRSNKLRFDPDRIATMYYEVYEYVNSRS
ncbi:glycosyltransferase family 4 protein [Spirosoma agri]|uniref:Glycosyltransferase family 4 protein n=1 Tax=Spirosoma agri TaxID=1987381 RepID=A0A6M0IIC4_9BACT|nr:glycosyltransferase family 1 protein [Spirosoma agri]NEU67445.1 glycosyltransferase family 4 protein [Spirosoma agri]